MHGPFDVSKLTFKILIPATKKEVPEGARIEVIMARFPRSFSPSQQKVDLTYKDLSTGTVVIAVSMNMEPIEEESINSNWATPISPQNRSFYGTAFGFLNPSRFDFCF